MLLVNYNWRVSIMSRILGVGGPLGGLGLTLYPYIQPLSPSVRVTRTAALAAAATFTGSAPIVGLTWGAVYKDGMDNVYQDAGEIIWICSVAPLASQTAYGIVWDDGVNVGLDPFITPVVIANIGDPIRYIPSFSYGQ